MDGPKEYRTALNALRGFAALYVVLYHLRHFTTIDWFTAYPPLRFGYIGVDFFFILSGLIISHVYLEKSQGAPFAFWSEFLWLRLARLFPVHLFIMLLMLLAAFAGPIFDADLAPPTTEQLNDWVSVTLLYRQWLLPTGYTWNSPAWSVSAELFAYTVVFPALAVCFARVERRKLAAGLISTGALLFMIVLWKNGTVNMTYGVGPLMRVTAGFLTGAGLFLLLKNRAPNLEWDSKLRLVVIGSIAVFILADMFKNLRFVADILLIIFLAVLICVTYRAEGRLAELMSTKPLFWLGEISFSLYLCHGPVFKVLHYLAESYGIECGYLFGFAGVALSIVTAHLLYSFLEIPARQYMRNGYQKVSGGIGKSLTTVR